MVGFLNTFATEVSCVEQSIDKYEFLIILGTVHYSQLLYPHLVYVAWRHWLHLSLVPTPSLPQQSGQEQLDYLTWDNLCCEESTCSLVPITCR